MATAQNTPLPADDSSVLETIRTFESILEIIPDDVNTLTSLALAYAEVGDLSRARDIMLRLARILAAQGEWARLLRLTENNALQPLALDGEYQQYLRQAERALHLEPGPAAPAAPAAKPPPEILADLNTEMELAWFLLEKEQLTQDQYESAVNRLTESHISGKGRGSVSLLLELRHMGGVDLDTVVAFLSGETRTPFIDLSRCEIPEEVAGLLSLETMRRLSAVPFAVMGQECMVAVLNPVSQALRATLATALGRTLHIYLTSPDELQSALDALQKKRPAAPSTSPA